MNERHHPISLDTLGSMRDAGYGLTAHCNMCRGHSDVDLEPLIERLGPQTPVLGGWRRVLTCPTCGSNDVGLMVRAPGQDVPARTA